jgi:hypothetical protein
MIETFGSLVMGLFACALFLATVSLGGSPRSSGVRER